MKIFKTAYLKRIFWYTCAVYTGVSLFKFIVEAIFLGEFGKIQSDLVTGLLFSLIGVIIILQFKRLINRFTPLIAILIQYTVLVACIFAYVWISGLFIEPHPDAYQDMFRSVSIPYAVVALSYYIYLYFEIKRYNRLIQEVKSKQTDTESR